MGRACNPQACSLCEGGKLEFSSIGMAIKVVMSDLSSSLCFLFSPNVATISVVDVSEKNCYLDLLLHFNAKCRWPSKTFSRTLLLCTYSNCTNGLLNNSSHFFKTKRFTVSEVLAMGHRRIEGHDQGNSSIAGNLRPLHSS